MAVIIKKEAGHKPNSVDVIISLAKPLPVPSLRSYPKAPFSGLEKSEADRLKASLFDLAPDGVCHAVALAWNAVGSYPTISPLPLSPLGTLRRFIFCGTFLQPSPHNQRPLRLGRPGVTRHPVLRSSDFPQPVPKRNRSRSRTCFQKTS